MSLESQAAVLIVSFLTRERRIPPAGRSSRDMRRSGSWTASTLIVWNRGRLATVTGDLLSQFHQEFMKHNCYLNCFLLNGQLFYHVNLIIEKSVDLQKVLLRSQVLILHIGHLLPIRPDYIVRCFPTVNVPCGILLKIERTCLN